VTKADSAAIDVKSLRDRTQIKAIVAELESNSDKLVINPTVMAELTVYMRTADLIPKRIDVADRRSVDQVQEALQQLQSRVDRVIAVQASIFKINRALGKLDILVIQDLAEAGEINGKTSGTATRQILGIVIPELAIHQHKWKAFERFCLAVQNHLGDAKDTLRMQIKLDETANWNRRYSGNAS